MTERSDGSTASYYELPEWARELADLIRFRNMNGTQAEMFRALYRGDSAEHSDEQRQAKKLLAYAVDEVVRTHFPEKSFKHYRDAVFAAIFKADPEPVALAEDSGWIPWAGKLGMPNSVAPDQRVEVKLRDGGKTEGQASGFLWGWFEHEDWDIVAYRIVCAAPTKSLDWTSWEGGDSAPSDVAPDQLIEMKLRSGRVLRGLKQDHSWQRHYDYRDIVAYRVAP